ncbi:MAG: 2-oxo acid dehydrogenase subunit E2, partial [Sphingomicrobium sp.]
MSTDVNVPTLGESITEATVGQWLKNPGDSVAQDEPIVSLETDKVAVEVNAPVAGTLAEQLVKEGDTVAVGALIARIDDGGAVAAAPAAAKPEPQAEVAGAPVNPAGPAETPRPRESGDPAPAHDAALTLSPAVRRAVLANHVDPSAIKGSGKDGRITKDDVLAAATSKTSAPASAQAAASSAPAPTGERREERIKISRMRQTIATRLKEAQNTAALLTTFNDVDMTAVIDARAKYKDLFEKKHGIRLGFMGFFVKAVALAAKDVPSVNASIEGDTIVYHDYLDVSVAVSAPKGLVVPVVRDADRMSFAEIEKAIAAY